MRKYAKVCESICLQIEEGAIHIEEGAIHISKQRTNKYTKSETLSLLELLTYIHRHRHTHTHTQRHTHTHTQAHMHKEFECMSRYKK